VFGSNRILQDQARLQISLKTENKLMNLIMKTIQIKAKISHLLFSYSGLILLVALFSGQPAFSQEQDKVAIEDRCKGKLVKLAYENSLIICYLAN